MGEEIQTEKLGGFLLTLYLFFCFPAVSLLLPEGYLHLSEHKFAIWRAVSIGFAVPLAGVALFFLFQKFRKHAGRMRLHPADIAVLLYTCSLTVSFLLSCWKNEALWGTEGWRTGYLSELLMLLFYFFARLFPVFSKPVLYAVCLTGGLVSLPVLASHLFRLYIPVPGADPAYVSTIGNADWACVYFAVVIPVAAAVWIAAEKRVHRAGGFVLLVMGMLSVLLLGTDTGWMLFVSAGVALAAALTAERDGAGRRISRAAVVLLYLLLLLPVLFRFDLSAASVLPSAWKELLTGDSFGNMRGAIWRISWSLYRALPPLQKLFGTGPDTYAAAAYGMPEISARIFPVFGAARLTNAHNEWLTMLITEGAVCTGCWLMFVICASAEIYCGLKRHRAALTLSAFLVIITSSAVQMTMFRTVLTTPFFLIFAGAALKKTGKSEDYTVPDTGTEGITDHETAD